MISCTGMPDYVEFNNIWKFFHTFTDFSIKLANYAECR